MAAVSKDFKMGRAAKQHRSDSEDSDTGSGSMARLLREVEATIKKKTLAKQNKIREAFAKRKHDIQQLAIEYLASRQNAVAACTAKHHTEHDRLLKERETIFENIQRVHHSLKELSDKFETDSKAVGSQFVSDFDAFASLTNLCKDTLTQRPAAQSKLTSNLIESEHIGTNDPNHATARAPNSLMVNQRSKEREAGNGRKRTTANETRGDKVGGSAAVRDRPSVSAGGRARGSSDGGGVGSGGGASFVASGIADAGLETAAARLQHNQQPLPPRWEMRFRDGKPYFINLYTHEVTFTDPRTNPHTTAQPGNLPLTVTYGNKEPLPPGWEMRNKHDGKVYFMNLGTRTATWEDPRESLQELRNAKPLPQGAAQQPGMPSEPTYLGRTLSKYITIYLVIIPILFIAVLSDTISTHSQLGLTTFTSDVIFAIVDLVIMIGFNALGFNAVRHMIPEYMSVFIYFYVANAGVKIVWSAVFWFILFQIDLPSVVNGTPVTYDERVISQVLVTSFLISTAITLLYTWWIVARMFIPFREYALAVRRVLEGNAMGGGVGDAPAYVEVEVGKQTA
ncbi:hypothetical protein HDU98_008164 [Podochytrium sp. JEL0797]|nr:hypothetical protein HDU98_008164 [Podochytrium sp. JEL0797]